MKFNIALMITWLRIGMAPACFVLLLSGFPLWAVVLFAVASFSDGLDGYLARKYDLVTEFGKRLDPIADKVLVLLVSCALLYLSYSFELALVIVLLSVRELLVSYLRSRFSHVTGLAVSHLAKWKTTMQMIALSVLMLALKWPVFSSYGLFLLQISLVLSWLSFRSYAKNVREHLTISEAR